MSGLVTEELDETLDEEFDEVGLDDDVEDDEVAVVEEEVVEEEVEEALAENVDILNSYGPKRIVVEDGKVTGVEFKKCLSVFDEKGRFAPKFDENDLRLVSCGTVLVSVGQDIEWGEMLKGSACELNPNKTVKCDDFTYQSAQPDVFVGGDCYTGPRFAIDAITAG